MAADDLREALEMVDELQVRAAAFRERIVELATSAATACTRRARADNDDDAAATQRAAHAAEEATAPIVADFQRIVDEGIRACELRSVELDANSTVADGGTTRLLDVPTTETWKGAWDGALRVREELLAVCSAATFEVRSVHQRL